MASRFGIAGNALFKLAGFSDVKDGTLFAKHPINTRRVIEVFQILLYARVPHLVFHNSLTV